MKISEYITKLNEKTLMTKDTTRAKKIRKNLLGWGGASLVLGIVMFFVGFIGFAVSGFSDVVNFNGFQQGGLSSAVYWWILCAIAIPFIAVGGVCVKWGLAIVVAIATINYADVSDRCPKCGDPIEGNEKFCSKCGEPLEKILTCSNCGKKIRLNDKFCKECGTSININSEAENIVTNFKEQK